jgi:pseudaminic acid biosynthesis-associated methylase
VVALEEGIVSTPQEKFWAGEFGSQYTVRNRVNWHARKNFWDLIIERTAARSVLEVGCNAGWNLLALRDADPTIKLRGVDLNPDALTEAGRYALDAREMSGVKVGAEWPNAFQLVFTAGVLIHVPPQVLEKTMRSIVAASSRWVLAVEYAANQEEEVDYRGHAERLWRRPYGALYAGLGLAIEMEGQLAKGDGFDNCEFWLLRKPTC